MFSQDCSLTHNVQDNNHAEKVHLSPFLFGSYLYRFVKTKDQKTHLDFGLFVATDMKSITGKSRYLAHSTTITNNTLRSCYNGRFSATTKPEMSYHPPPPSLFANRLHTHLERTTISSLFCINIKCTTCKLGNGRVNRAGTTKMAINPCRSRADNLALLHRATKGASHFQYLFI
ncbi:hypothetical protein KIN20_005309 [Parelaphostrongylus tenuis]|uniref:Uncharacterized protein n=1 Tax=Parelaphostrongylus tenuis TaxID=148309 RepID=A0AAD5QF24_PARTN|nr:hypothetical protein KIN20_005309 [Parelaphostrongylus tenuis]